MYIRQYLIIVLLMLAGFVSPVVNAGSDSVMVNVSAQVVATTCAMSLYGGNGDGKNNTIDFGNTRGGSDLINNPGDLSFIISAKNCSGGVSKINTIITGTESPEGSIYLSNTAIYSGKVVLFWSRATLARADTPQTYLSLNNCSEDNCLTWSEEDISAGEINLVMDISRRTDPIGDIKASKDSGEYLFIYTFNFTYE